VPKTLGDPCAQHDALFLQLQHGPPVHLSGVDEVTVVVHAALSLSVEVSLTFLRFH
jgi:hypothetical protein